MMTEERLKKALEIAANVATLHREELERYKWMYKKARDDAEYWRQRYEELHSKIESFMMELEHGASAER